MSNRKSRLVILSLLLAIGSTSLAIDPNLVGWWEFEEGSGAIAYDSSGNSNDGTLKGDPNWVSGKAGDYALDFDGLAGDGFMDSVQLSAIAALEGDLVTVAAWIYANDFATYNTVLAQYNTSYNGYSLYTYNNQPSFYIGGGIYLEAVSPEALNTGQWYHLAGTNDGSSLKIYVDGIPKAEVTSVGYSGVNYNAYIGCDSSYAFFNGVIDDVRVYNRALSEEELLQLYRKAFNPEPADESQDVELNTVLSWTAGYQALSHDVYLGTNFYDVSNATVDSNEYMGNFDVNSYDPCGLDWGTTGTTYYWRIDEENSLGTAKGDVWVFTTVRPSKTTIVFPDDPFRNDGVFAEEPGWVKFTIKLDAPNTVYFQDSQLYVFHYDFATAVLPPFIGMNPSEYYDVTLQEFGQQAVLGAVILPSMAGEPPAAAFNEYGIQFIRYDPYTKEEIRDMFNVVKANVLADPGVEAFYFPTYEQLVLAEANRDWFEAEGITVSSTARWAEGNACYSEGWALGELKYFAGDQIEAAYLAGNLLPEDILLTDGVPAEIPFVAGILSLLPSTPNSHVAILARTFGVPFAHLAVAEDANSAQQFVGHTILLSVSEDGGVCEVSLKDLEGILTPEEIAEILTLKEPPELNIQPIASFGDYSADTNDLVPADIQYFGGKAANYGILREAIPEKCPVATAFSFDLWNEFLDQIITGGNSLREELDARLSSYGYPPSNMAALSAELESIREDLFKNTYVTSFTQAQEDAVIGVLQDPNYGFDINSKIRFRSSTNVEDSNQFTGAGLYDSYSGCLADDLDGDGYGPCICDAEENNERGVFRAIRKVFASFYNDNAFLERLRHDVNEADVGMAILVHHSFPDEFELANGVAILEKKETDPNIYIELVTQDGATSVANPEDGSIPEEVSICVDPCEGTSVTLVQASNLVILGETVMEWQADYNDLSQLLIAAAEEFEQVTGKSYYILDFEYKKLAAGGAAIPSGGLVVKQIREIPQLEDTPTATTPLLVNEPKEYCIRRAEGTFDPGDIFARHRLKSLWTVETKSMWLTPENLQQSFYADVTIEYAADGRIRTLTGELPLLPFANHTFEGTDATDGWLMHHLPNRRTYELQTGNVPTQVSVEESPVVSLSDFGEPA